MKKTEKLERWTFKKQTEADPSLCKLLGISKLVQDEKFKGCHTNDCICVKWRTMSTCKYTWNYSVTEISCLQKANTEMETRGF